MNAWWESVDRTSLTLEVRTLLQSGGCLVLVGSDRAGRLQAANLCERFLTERGFSSFRIGRPSGVSSTRAALIRAIEKLSPPVGATVPMHIGLLGWSPGAVMREVVNQLQRLGNPAALLFDDIDFYGQMPLEHIPLWTDLGRQAGVPVIITSREEVGTNWAREPIKTLRLDPLLHREDVWATLLTAPELARRGIAELEEALSSVFPKGNVDLVLADDVYTILASWSKQWLN